MLYFHFSLQNSFLNNFPFMHAYLSLSVWYMYVLMPTETKEGTRLSEDGVIEGSKMNTYLDPNPDSVEGQEVL